MFFQGASDARIYNSTFININTLPNNSTIVWEQRSPQPSHPTMTSPGTRTGRRRHPNPLQSATTSEPGASRGANEPGAAGVSDRGRPTMFSNCHIGTVAGGTFNLYPGDATITVTSVCHQPPPQHRGRTTAVPDIEIGRNGAITINGGKYRPDGGIVDGQWIPRDAFPLPDDTLEAAAGGHRGNGHQPQTGPRHGPRHAQESMFPPDLPFHLIPRPSARPPPPPDSASSHYDCQQPSAGSELFVNTRIDNAYPDRVKVNGLTKDELFAGADVCNWVREPGSFGGDERGSERGDDGWRSERGGDEEMVPEECEEVDGMDTAEPGPYDPSVQPQAGPRITPPRKWS